MERSTAYLAKNWLVGVVSVCPFITATNKLLFWILQNSWDFDVDNTPTMPRIILGKYMPKINMN